MLDRLYFIVVISSLAFVCCGSGAEVEEVALLQLGRQNHKLNEATSAMDITAGVSRRRVGTGKETSHENALTRPGLADGTVDVIHFGILIKKWYGINLKESQFTADTVITLQWLDPRTSKMLPPNITSMSISIDTAEDLVWLPDIVVSNAIDAGKNSVSSSMIISSNGEVTMVMRIFPTMRQAYDTSWFPFDSQNVSIVIASATYMRDELQLVQMNDTQMSGVSADVFNNSVWTLVDVDTRSLVDDNGMLRKSRGVCSVEVRRDTSQYISDIFIPSFIFLMMTWSALWLPTGGPYVMPRVAVNAFALLCQVSITREASHMLPESGNGAWLCDYLELCIELQFLVMLITIILIRIGKTDIDHASILTWHMLVAYPITTSVNMFMLFSGFKEASRNGLIATIIGYPVYLSWCYYFSARRGKPDDETET